MTTNLPPPLSTFEDIQSSLTRFDVAELARRCNDTEKKYCQLIVFNGKKKKDALKLAGSEAKDEYLSKMAYEMEQRPHVQAYLNELRNIRSSEAQVELTEVVLKTRLAIEALMLDGGKGASKAEPLLRLLAELGGFVKAPGGPTTAVQVNQQTTAPGTSLETDLHRLQQITGGK